MRLIRKKLKSERGASLILALLFMLICLMVGSSILMAAMANAGKIRSNQREQQAYMVLSSALKLVADDLTSAPYRAEFTYEQKKQTVLNGVEVTTHTFTCKAKTNGVNTPGEFPCELGEIFKNSLNVFFARNMMLRDNRVGTYTTQNVFMSDLTNLEKEDDATSFPLTDYEKGSFTVQSDKDELKDFEVTIEWKLEENYTLYLTATITDVPAEYKDAASGPSIYENYVMKAELTPAAGKTIPDVGKTSSTGEPTIEINNSLKYDEYAEKSKASEPEKLYSTPLQWEIGWITGNNEEKP